MGPSFSNTYFFFFVLQGNSATDGNCSKCWRESLKKEGGDVGSELSSSSKEAEKETVLPMEVEVGRPIAPKVEAAPVVTPKRRKKKASYKSMMKGMMKTQTPERDIEKERESLRKVTGGG